MDPELNFWKLPPEEKIYEAFSVLADNRYTIETPGMAKVTSSSGDKNYRVTWNEEQSDSGPLIRISSNDNASFWQGFTGYPIIAILMIVNKISFDTGVLEYFKGIPWKTLNKKFRNDYTKAVEVVLSGIKEKDVILRIRSEVENIYRQLRSLKLIREKGRGAR